jgi:hypothetical protein
MLNFKKKPVFKEQKFMKGKRESDGGTSYFLDLESSNLNNNNNNYSTNLC